MLSIFIEMLGLNEDTKIILLHLLQMIIMPVILINYGFKYKNEFQTLSNDISIYPSCYFLYGNQSINVGSSSKGNIYGVHLCYGD